MNQDETKLGTGNLETSKHCRTPLKKTRLFHHTSEIREVVFKKI